MKLLEGEDGDELREERFPALANLRRRDPSSFYTEIGRVGDKRFVMGLSCWYLSHPNHFCYQCNDNTSGEGIASPTGTVNIAYKSFIMLSYIIKYYFVVCYFSQTSII